MSIRHALEKIKGPLRDDRVFMGLLLILVAVLFFGLGRLSVTSMPLERSMIKKGVTQTSLVVDSLVHTPATSTTATRVETSTSTGAYVGSRKGSKYHLPWCSGAQRIAEENKVWFKDKEEAQKAGYTPAGNCPGI